MAFECGVMSEDWRFAVIISLHKGKREKTECDNYRDTRLLNGVGKIYARILKDRIQRD